MIVSVQGNLDVTGSAGSSGGGAGNVAGGADAVTPAEEPGFHVATEEFQKSGSSGEKPTNTETNEKVLSPRLVFFFLCLMNVIYLNGCFLILSSENYYGILGSVKVCF